MSITITNFGDWQGRTVRQAVLESGGARVAVLSWGCVLRDWRARVGDEWRPVTLGFERFEDYPEHSRSFGVIAGRVANRIAGARFMLEGREVRLTPNEGPHMLHGGAVGLARRVWEMEADGEALRLIHDSPDGEDGFPGEVRFEIVLRLEGAKLTYDMRAEADRLTPINLAQHSYWNLDGGGDVLGHRLRLAASGVTPTGPDLIPTGGLAAVDGTALDFRKAREMRDETGEPLPLDLNFALDEVREGPAAELLSSAGDLRLRLWTDQPGVQVYNSPKLDVAVPGLEGARYGAYAGVCLEAQNFPDAVNREDFPDALFGPDRPYRQRLEIEIAPTPLAA